MKEVHTAPIQEGDIAGKAIYSLNGKEIGSVNILYSNSVSKMQFFDCLEKVLHRYGMTK